MQLVMPRTAHCLVVRALSSLTGPGKKQHTQCLLIHKLEETVYVGRKGKS